MGKIYSGAPYTHDFHFRSMAAGVLKYVYTNGYTWKPNKDVKHLIKRKRKKHIPLDWTLDNYNHLIMDIMQNKSNSSFLYFKEGFDKNYFIFGDGQWIVIIGEDCVIEIAFPPGQFGEDYKRYLDPSEEYHYIGTIQEVLVYE